jgi:phospholipase C
VGTVARGPFGWRPYLVVLCAVLLILLNACTRANTTHPVVAAHEQPVSPLVVDRSAAVRALPSTGESAESIAASLQAASAPVVTEPIAGTPTPEPLLPRVVNEVERLAPLYPSATQATSAPTASAKQASTSVVSPRPASSVGTVDRNPVHLTAAIPVRMPPGLVKIKHFVFIMQENRSFDSYFGTYPGADGIPPGVCVPNPAGGTCVRPYHDTSDVNRGGPHGPDNVLADIDHGRMDGFVAQAYGTKSKNAPDPCPPNALKCLPGQDPRDVMGWHDYHEIPNYWNYARLYVLQDHMFASAASFTLPNRLYLLAGQSGGFFSYRQPRPTKYNFAVITEQLSQKHVDWKVYVTSGTRPNPVDGHVVGSAEAQMEMPHEYTYFNPLPAFPAIQNDPEQRGRLVDTTQFYEDARAGRLPQVSWVIPTEPVSEHPPYNIRYGMAYVTGLVNAVMESPDWSSTAIFISYDEWGGFYDHVPPTSIDEYGLGLRVPGLVISPYARQGFVDHTVHSSASWLKIVEERFGLVPLTERDATANDMIEVFDFSQKPRPPVILSATAQGSPYPQPLQKIERAR